MLPQTTSGFTDDALVALLRDGLPALLAVYRYGSAGTVFERPESDLDLAVLAEAPVDFATRARLTAELAQMLGRDVDLNDMRSLPVTLRVQIVTGGARLFAVESAWLEAYESRVLSDYAYLNEKRRPILEDIRARGSIFG